MSADFGSTLKRLRKNCGFTQQQLADVTGMTQVQIARLEKNHSSPLWDTVQKLAKALGVSTEAFVGTSAEDELFPAEAPKPARRPKNK